METLPLYLLILAGLPGSFPNEDLQGKCFVFPEASKTAAVFLKAPSEQPLTSFTVCLRHYTLLTRQYALFSYASKRNANEALLFKPKPNEYRLHLGTPFITFVLPDKQDSKYGWEHICMGWESSTGLVTLWVNGSPLPRVGLQKGLSIVPEASIVLGQDQDVFGGGFDSDQSYVGEIKDVYMWDRMLTGEEVFLTMYDRPVNNSLVDWRSLNYESRGYVVLKPPLSSF